MTKTKGVYTHALGAWEGGALVRADPRAVMCIRVPMVKNGGEGPLTTAH